MIVPVANWKSLIHFELGPSARNAKPFLPILAFEPDHISIHQAPTTSKRPHDHSKPKYVHHPDFKGSGCVFTRTMICFDFDSSTTADQVNLQKMPPDTGRTSMELPSRSSARPRRQRSSAADTITVKQRMSAITISDSSDPVMAPNAETVNHSTTESNRPWGRKGKVCFLQKFARWSNSLTLSSGTHTSTRHFPGTTG